ncbi:exodeoxyribonuclease V subunit alpha [Mobilicoccus caccae]|uniref:RecBCD enzyme subunit RecD n=1 Tax=Mobilicoccus caccae TaxID=1859295 RepID=A0ABQ6IZG9_9MICO|nr:exodeoxyribonuclease V subunit alpha [Mobilicoccus caccae]GMA42093.1 hypothetical protein GCM10025883_41380 [Mobilicoccus caccae]
MSPTASIPVTVGGGGGLDLDARYALRAPEPLATFNRAGYLRAADVHVAIRLAALAEETDPRVLLASALLVRVVRDGSTCLDLATGHELAPEVIDDPDLPGEPGDVGQRDGHGAAPVDRLPWPEAGPWMEAVAASPLVAAGVLRIEEGLLYLDRYWGEERSVCADLLARREVSATPTDEDRLEHSLSRIFPDAGHRQQREASARLARSMTGVLTGGPGSGKTTTVAGLLAVLADQSDEPLRIALTAPTGKAAARLQEAVAAASAAFPGDARARLEGLEASTLHRLLGWRPGSRTRFRHDRSNTLPHDVVVVDESSMLSLTLTARLLEALRPTTRLVLVGDADQLASVDAGAVLGDLVGGLDGGGDGDGHGDVPGHDPGDGDDDTPGPDGDHRPVAEVVRLTGSHRYSGAIGELARAVRAGDTDAVLDVLRTGESMRLVEDEDPAPVLRPRLVAHATAVREAARAGDGDLALEVLGRHRVLCVHRAGAHGVRTWNRRVEGWLTEETGDGLYDLMYVGRPLLVTTNDYGLGLYNGDTGVVVQGETGEPPVAVMAGSSGTVVLAATRLSDVETLHAMTVHKAQGSEADDITVMLPPGDSPLLTRELLYTAVTRARRSVTVVGSEATVRAALDRRARRASGLAARLRRPSA